MQIDSVQTLVGAVQMGCIECTNLAPLKQVKIGKPDTNRSATWIRTRSCHGRPMLRATQLCCAVLERIGFWHAVVRRPAEGKGLAIVIIPLARATGFWERRKRFLQGISGIHGAVA